MFGLMLGYLYLFAGALTMLAAFLTAAWGCYGVNYSDSRMIVCGLTGAVVLFSLAVFLILCGIRLRRP